MRDDHDGEPSDDNDDGEEPRREVPAPDVALSLSRSIVPPDLSERIAASIMPADFVERIATAIAASGITEQFAVSIAASSLAAVLERIRQFQYEPPNWDEIDREHLEEVIGQDGIPLVWVPRAGIVDEVLAAPARPERIGVLLDHLEEVLQDCRAVLDTVEEETLAGQVPLARRAIDALAAGHREAAQALAVAVTETAISANLGNYKAAIARTENFDLNVVGLADLRLDAALAPISCFYTPWFPSSGTQAPEALSRHVSVHQADLRHYTPGNAVVAVLLATSILRALQDFRAENPPSSPSSQRGSR